MNILIISGVDLYLKGNGSSAVLKNFLYKDLNEIYGIKYDIINFYSTKYYYKNEKNNYNIKYIDTYNWKKIYLAYL